MTDSVRVDLAAMITNEADRLRTGGDTETATRLETCASSLREACQNPVDLRYSLESVRDNADEALRLLG